MSFELALLSLTLISILLQLYVIFVIIKASPPSMHPYRYFLIFYTVWDLLFTASIGVGLQPTSSLSGVSARGLFTLFGQEGVHLGVCSIFFFGTMAVDAQEHCMMYRMVMLLKHEQLKKWCLSYQFKLLSFMLMVMIASCYSIPMYSIQLQGTAMIHNNATAMVVVAVDPHSRLTFLYAAALIGGLMTVEVECFVLAGIIFRTLRKNRAHFSSKTYRMHIQLTLLLVLQLSNIIVCIVIPLGGVCLMNMISGAPLSLQMGFFALTLYATINSILTLVFVTPYRKYTMKWWWWRWVKKGNVIISPGVN